jgi:hypothetical protein
MHGVFFLGGGDPKQVLGEAHGGWLTLMTGWLVRGHAVTMVGRAVAHYHVIGHEGMSAFSSGRMQLDV